MKRSSMLALSAALVLSAGCASLPPGSHPDPRDRFERFNRASFRFNMAMDRAVLRPVARGYVRVVPAPLRRGLGNFLDNLTYPATIVNQALQGKFRLAGADSARFLINTLGGAGFFDPASRAGLAHHKEDLGQTLGRWGVRPGPFLMLPFLGPSSLRDGVALVPDEYLKPRHYLQQPAARYGLSALDLLDTRASLLSTDATLDQAYDPYAFVRNAWLQHREYEVKDGKVPDESPDELPLDDEDGGASAPAPAAAPAAPATVPAPATPPPEAAPPH